MTKGEKDMAEEAVAVGVGDGRSFGTRRSRCCDCIVRWCGHRGWSRFWVFDRVRRLSLAKEAEKLTVDRRVETGGNWKGKVSGLENCPKNLGERPYPNS